MDMPSVFRLMEEDLQKVERQFEENLRSDVSLIPTMGKYVLSSGGKRMRPLALLLAARMCGYRGERAIPLASIVEFVHTATLLHDDVVDNANLRRGQRSANEVWGNSASVLVGDFLFTKSFSLMVTDNDLQVLKAMSDATTAMAEGEVLQLLKTCDLEISEDEYLEVVINKTAVLIAAACEIGGILGGVGEERTAALWVPGDTSWRFFQGPSSTENATAVIVLRPSVARALAAGYRTETPEMSGRSLSTTKIGEVLLLSRARRPVFERRSLAVTRRR